MLRSPPFALFWSASTLSGFGTAVTGVAVQVLIVDVLHASPVQIGVMRALGVAPYLVLGLVVGALMDRWRRKPVLIVASVGRALALSAVPALLALGLLHLPSLGVIVGLVGVLTLFTESASQPFLPALVQRRALVTANARLGQSDAVSASAGPALGGTLLAALGASLTLLLDTTLSIAAAILLSRIQVAERFVHGARHRLLHEVVEGIGFVYRHRTLAPEAVSLHVWFLGYSILTTLFAAFVLLRLHLGAAGLGLSLGLGGAGGFIGALLAPRIGRLLGAGRAVLLGRVLIVLPPAALAALPVQSGASALGFWIAAAAQCCVGLAAGVEDANEMAYRQAVAPDAVQGRMNTTIRTANRTVLFFGALSAGLLATLLDYRTTFCIAAAVFALAAVILAASPFRNAVHDGD